MNANISLTPIEEAMPDLFKDINSNALNVDPNKYWYAGSLAPITEKLQKTASIVPKLQNELKKLSKDYRSLVKSNRESYKLQEQEQKRNAKEEQKRKLVLKLIGGSTDKMNRRTKPKQSIPIIDECKFDFAGSYSIKWYDCMDNALKKHKITIDDLTKYGGERGANIANIVKPKKEAFCGRASHPGGYDNEFDGYMQI